MISSAEEFISLRSSDDPTNNRRATAESAHVDVWLDVVSRYPDMKFWVAQNKTVPLIVLKVLARDEDARVRSLVAMKGSLSNELFLILSNDHDGSVRQRIAYNKKTPYDVLEFLSHDREELVAGPARERLAEPSV